MLTTMFRRLNKNLPADPHYPTSLAALGYTLTPRGQFVKTPSSSADQAQFMTFFLTDNDRANEVHKEALHTCAREAVLSNLAALGVKELFVNGDAFVDVRPEGPHTSILATGLEELGGKRDVVVVVGECMQDLGVWAYRILMREGGVEGGSAAGLVKKIRCCWGQGGREGDVASAEEAVQKLKLDGHAETDGQKIDDEENDTPGLILLNPGQLLYSHALNRPLSQPTWLARPKPTALDDPIRIDPVHNRVPGHETPEAHVNSIFEHVLPRITRPDVRLYIVGLSEGGEAVLQYLDEKLSTDAQALIGEKLEAVVLIQPTHRPGEVKSESLANFLAVRGRSWIVSEKPKGMLVNVPNFGGQMMADSAEAGGISASQASFGKTHKRTREGSVSATSQAIDIPGSSQHRRRLHADEDDDDEAAVAASISPLHSSSSNPCALHNKLSLDRNVDGSYSLPASAAAMQQSIASLASLQSNGSGNSGPMEKSESTISKSHLLAQSKESLEQDPYGNEPVNCATFSAGWCDGLPELVWPAVMGDVLKWFRGVAVEAGGVQEEGAGAPGAAVGRKGKGECDGDEFQNGDTGFDGVGDGVKLD